VDEERCELFIELGPGGVLAGLLNRIRKGTPCVSITDSRRSKQPSPSSAAHPLNPNS